MLVCNVDVYCWALSMPLHCHWRLIGTTGRLPRIITHVLTGCRTFRRQISGRFVDSRPIIAIRNTPTPWLFKLLLFSFIRPKVFSNCISISNQTFSCIHWHCSCMLIGRGRSPGRADRVSAGSVVSNSEPLSPHRTPGLACGGELAKYHKYSSETQINVRPVARGGGGGRRVRTHPPGPSKKGLN